MRYVIFYISLFFGFSVAVAAQGLPPISSAALASGVFVAGPVEQAHLPPEAKILGRFDYAAAVAGSLKVKDPVYLVMRIDQIDSDENWFYYFVSVSTTPATPTAGKFPREKYVLISKSRLANFRLGQIRAVFATYHGATESDEFDPNTGVHTKRTIPVMLATYIDASR